MNLCFITRGHYPDQGRTAHFEFSRTAAQFGHNVTVLAVGRPDEPPVSRQGRLEIQRFYTAMDSERNTWGFIKEAAGRFREMNRQFDIIHTFFFRGASTIRQMERHSARKWAIDLRTVSQVGGLRQLRRNLLTFGEMAQFDLRFVISNEVARRELGNRLSYVELPLGINLDLFQPRQTPLSPASSGTDLLYVGSLAELRRLDQVLHAFALARQQSPSLSLTMVGDGDYRARLEGLAQALGISESVRFTGYIPYESIGAQIAQADICIAYVPTTSWYDRAPVLKTLEYLASAKPVIATSTEWHRNIITPGVNGVLAEDNPEALAQAMVQVATDARLRAALIQKRAFVG